MKLWQSTFLIIFGVVNLLVLLKGYYEIKYKNNAYGLVAPLIFLGVIAWGDAIIFGILWIVTSVVCLVLKDWYLFLLVYSVFWVVRSVGETIYWFNQQFSSKVYKWNEPKNLFFHSIFHNDSVWCFYQMWWQTITVISIVFTIYLTKLWIDLRF